MAERSKAAVLKTAVGDKPTGGSNPSPSAYGVVDFRWLIPDWGMAPKVNLHAPIRDLKLIWGGARVGRLGPPAKRL
jgi:hypothetical protein